MLRVGNIQSPIISAVITQSATPYALIGTEEKLLPPPSVAQPITGGNYNNYVRVTEYVAENPRYLSVVDGQIIIEKPMRYFSGAAYAVFSHSHNNSVVSFVFGFERNGMITFSQRPLANEAPNLGEPVAISGGGQFVAEEGDKISVWIASNRSGNVKILNSNLTLIGIQ